MKRRDFLKATAIAPLVPWAAMPSVPLTKTLTIQSAGHAPGSEDDLDTINGGVDGGFVYLRGGDGQPPYSVRSGGNILLVKNVDMVLKDEGDTLWLVYSRERKMWVEGSRSARV